MMILAVVMILGTVKSAKQVVCCYPTIQALRLSRNHLDVQIAIRQLEACRFTSEIAHFLQNDFALYSGEYAHAGGGKEKKGRVRNLGSGNDAEGMFKEFLEMFGADVVRVFAKGGYAWMDLLGPLFVRLDLGEALQLCCACVLSRRVTIQPSVNMDARPRGPSVQYNTISPYKTGVVSYFAALCSG